MLFSSLADLCYRTAYRIAYPCVIAVRRWSKTHHYDGVTVAVWCGDSVLMVRHSYRPGLLLPGGGVKPGEDPKACVIRELYEEVGIIIADPACLMLVDVRPRSHGAGDIRLYETFIDDRPVLKIDRREIIYACFLSKANIQLSDIKDAMMVDYIKQRI